MFSLAILIGVYSYLIFGLGLLHLLYKNYIAIMTVAYLFFCTFWYKESLKNLFIWLRRLLREGVSFKKDYFLLIFLIVAQAIVNLIGSLGPELGFDALWYHLTIPKLYLENHSIFYIHGGLLYYSLMPKLTEMLYTAALALNGEIMSKLIHFSFGLLSIIALYKLSRKFFSKHISLLVVVVFYANLVVAWESITAYIDLARTFFEIMALWGFVNFICDKETPSRRSLLGKRIWLIESAIMLGLAISTKLLAVGSLLIFIILIVLYKTSRLGFQPRSKNNVSMRDILLYWLIAIFISLPWLVFAFVHTGNPIYPFFSSVYKTNIGISLINPFKFISDTWIIFTRADDPISPIYIILLPFVIIFFKTFSSNLKLVALYSFLGIIVWYLTPRMGGGRFLLPYLPGFSIVVGAILEKIKEQKMLYRLSVLLIIIVALISVFYRGVANVKYIPTIIRRESKRDFLATHLNFSFGDFYDTDNYFKTHIKKRDKVLLYGFHNLYYVEFAFIDSSYVKKGDEFNYVAVQNSNLPQKFRAWDLVYYNPITKVKLYTQGRIKWSY